MKRLFLTLSMAVGLALLAASPPSHARAAVALTVTASTPSSRSRVATDLGKAYYAFHHDVYLPYRSGALRRTRAARVRAGVALVFMAQQVRAAATLARGGRARALQALAPRLRALATLAQADARTLKSGRYNPIAIGTLNNVANAVQIRAMNSGYAFMDVRTAVPGVS